MLDIKELEDLFMKKMKDAALNGNSEEILSLSKAGEMISELKSLHESLQLKYNQAKAIIDAQYPIIFTQILTSGAHDNNYMSLRFDSLINGVEPIKPADNQEVEVEFKGFGIVKTQFLKRYNRFKSRKEVKAFFEENGLIPGSILRITQISQNKFSVEVESKF